jgi:hypothetical protein
LNGERPGKSIIIVGDAPRDGPLLSDPDFIRQSWSSDASVENMQRYKSDVPTERCYGISMASTRHLGFWATTIALPLPPNHNLPPGFVFDINQTTLDNFILRLSAWSG